jgi:hypothetical protein
MEVFYIAVLAIATATLILILTSVGVLIRKSNTDAPWPPTAGRCPDGWTETSDGKCTALSGTSEELIKSNTNTDKTIFDFKDMTPCAKKEWTTKWSVQWDGVSNYNKC